MSFEYRIHFPDNSKGSGVSGGASVSSGGASVGFGGASIGFGGASHAVKKPK